MEVQTKKFGLHPRLLLHDAPENWCIQVHFCAYAHKTQPFSKLYVSSFKMLFQTQPRIPLKFHLNLSRNQFRENTAQSCIDLPPHFSFQPIDSNATFHSIMLKQLSNLFLAIEIAILQAFSNVHQYAPEELLQFMQCKT